MLRNHGPESRSSALTGHVEDEIVRSLRQIIRAVDLQSRRLTEDYGLTGPQLVTLLEVQRQGKVSASTLAREVHLSGATMTGILRRLENRGLVSRGRSKTDRRSVDIELTDAGRDVLERAPSPLQDTFRRELERVAEWELHQILATLKRVAFMMDADAIPAAPHLVTGVIEPAEPGHAEPAATDQVPVEPGGTKEKMP